MEDWNFRHFRWEDIKYGDDLRSDYFENIFTNYSRYAGNELAVYQSQI